MNTWLSHRLLKIFQGSLKILEDLHEDPSADLWGPLLKILKDLQNSCQDPQGSREDLRGSLRVFTFMLKIFVKSSEILARSLKMLKVLCQDSQRSLRDPYWSLHGTHRSLPYPQDTNLCKILADLSTILTDLCHILTNSPQLYILWTWNFH